MSKSGHTQCDVCQEFHNNKNNQGFCTPCNNKLLSGLIALVGVDENYKPTGNYTHVDKKTLKFGCKSMFFYLLDEDIKKINEIPIQDLKQKFTIH